MDFKMPDVPSTNESANDDGVVIDEETANLILHGTSAPQMNQQAMMEENSFESRSGVDPMASSQPPPGGQGYPRPMHGAYPPGGMPPYRGNQNMYDYQQQQQQQQQQRQGRQQGMDQSQYQQLQQTQQQMHGHPQSMDMIRQLQQRVLQQQNQFAAMRGRPPGYYPPVMPQGNGMPPTGNDSGAPYPGGGPGSIPSRGQPMPARGDINPYMQSNPPYPGQVHHQSMYPNAPAAQRPVMPPYQSYTSQHQHTSGPPEWASNLQANGNLPYPTGPLEYPPVNMPIIPEPEAEEEEEARAPRPQRRSTRLRKTVTPAPVVDDDEDASPAPSPAPKSSPSFAENNEDAAEPSSFVTGAANKASWVELILHLETKRKSEWKEIMAKMNTSKVINGSRLEDESLGLVAIYEQPEEEEAAEEEAEGETEQQPQDEAETAPKDQAEDGVNPAANEGEAGAGQTGEEIEQQQGEEDKASNGAEGAENLTNIATAQDESAAPSAETAAKEEEQEPVKSDEQMTTPSPVPSETKTKTPDPVDPDPMEERFLIKWRDASYLHVSWETERDLYTRLNPELAGGRLDMRCKRAKTQPRNPYASQGGFNPDFLRAERILDEEENSYLIKWCVLGYDEATWETTEDLEKCDVKYQVQLDQYHARLQATEALASIPISERRRRIRMRGLLPQLSQSPEFKNGLKLRSYQLEALNWLCFNWCQNRNSILADEMGLGKTAQAISFAKIVGRNRGPVLVVAPLATLSHWQRELERWTDLNVVVFRGSASSRAACKGKEFYVNPQTEDWYKFDVLVTNFEAVLQEEAALTRCPYSLLVVDEAHRLKNRKSKLTMLLRDRMDFDSCLLLTGTPIQNDTTELWTLLNFVDRETFRSLDDFTSRFGSVTTAKDMEEFHSTLRPYLLRRFKADVEANLPSKEEVIIEVELTELQKYYYRSVYEQNVQTLLRGVIPGTRLNLNNVAIQLRKCCNHPYLIDGVEAKALQDAQANENDPHSSQRVMELLISASGKTILLDKLLPKLYQQKHRVLIFSQFVRLLDILEDYLRFRQYGYERIDGSVSGAKRQEAIDRFSAPDSTSFVFLLSTRGCGQGINLTSADTVIMFDSDWNPQNDVQAQARCHRIGQTKPVVVYRLITRKTYEQEMFTRASLKLGLDEAVNSKLQQSVQDTEGGVAGEDESKLSAGVTDQELEHMLKFGAYALRGEQTESDQTRAFCEADIDDILNTRATRVSQSQKQQEKARGSEKFSKATFVSRSSGEVDVEDPEFWSKVLGKDLAIAAEQDEDVITLGKGKRRRRNVVTYLDQESASYAGEKVPVPTTITRSMDSDYISRDVTPGPGERSILSKAALKSLIASVMMFGPERMDEHLKSIPSLSEENIPKFALGLILVCLVWQSKEPTDFELPFIIEGDDGDSIIRGCTILAEWLKNEPNVEAYSGVFRKSLLQRVQKLLQSGKEYEITREMVWNPRLKERCKETADILADQADVEAFIASGKQRPIPVVRGVPPCEGWKRADDRSALKACEYYGFERKRKPETWRDIFADERLKWTLKWVVELEDDPPEQRKAGGHRVHLKRLTSRFIRVVGLIAQTIPSSSTSSNLPEGGPASAKDENEADVGEITDEWNSTELDRVNNLVLKYGYPQDSYDIKISLDLLGGPPPTFESVFAPKLRRKTIDAIKAKAKEIIASAQQAADSDKTCPPSKKRLLNRVEMLRALWVDVLSSFPSTDKFLEFIGWFFRILHKHQRAMPHWWTPSLDMGLLRAVCRYGLDSWMKALEDEEILTAPPADMQAMPTPQELNKRFTALVNWFIANVGKSLPADVNLEECRARGVMLMKPPAEEELRMQTKKRQTQVDEVNEKKAAKLKRKELVLEKKMQSQAERDAKRAKRLEEQRALRAFAKAERQAMKQLNQGEKPAGSPPKKRGRKSAASKVGSTSKANAAAVGVAVDGVVGEGDGLLMTSALPAGTESEKKKRRRRRKKDSDDEISLEEVWQPDPSRRKRLSRATGSEESPMASAMSSPTLRKRSRKSAVETNTGEDEGQGEEEEGDVAQEEVSVSKNPSSRSKSKKSKSPTRAGGDEEQAAGTGGASSSIPPPPPRGMGEMPSMAGLTGIPTLQNMAAMGQLPQMAQISQLSQMSQLPGMAALGQMPQFAQFGQMGAIPSIQGMPIHMLDPAHVQALLQLQSMAFQTSPQQQHPGNM